MVPYEVLGHSWLRTNLHMSPKPAPYEFQNGTRAIPKNQELPLKCFAGPNLHLLAPFELIPAGFCTIFQLATFWFSGLGATSGLLGPTCCPGTFWGRKLGVGKHEIMEEGFSEKVSRGSP